MWKVSSYFWPRLTDSGLLRSSDTWRGLSLVHFVSEHWTLIGRHDTCPVKRESVQVNTQIFLMHCKKSQEFQLDLWYPHHLPEQVGWMSLSLAITESHQVQSLPAITRGLSPKRCIQVNVVPAPCEPELCWSFPELHSDHSAPWAGSISAHRVWSGESWSLIVCFLCLPDTWHSTDVFRDEDEPEPDPPLPGLLYFTKYRLALYDDCFQPPDALLMSVWKYAGG